MRPVIIIGVDHYNTLSVIRSLGEAGVSIYLILCDTEKKNMTSQSCYCKKVFYATSENLYEIIKFVITQLGNIPILFPLSDFSAQLIDSHFQELEKYSIVPNSGGMIKIHQGKDKQKCECVRFGITVPTYEKIDLKRRNFNWKTYPAILKPISGTDGNKSDIRIVYNEPELEKEFDCFREKKYEFVLAEEYISSEDQFMVEIMGYVGRKKNVVITSIIKKIREYPLQNGSTSYAEFVQELAGFDIERLKEFISSTGYYGIFDVEFKYSQGKYYFIEINYRNGAPSYASTLYGCNIPYMFYCDAAGIEYTGQRKTASGLFMVEQKDWLHILKRDISVFKWISQYFSPKCKKIFWNRRDTKPFFYYFCAFVKMALKRIF